MKIRMAELDTLERRVEVPDGSERGPVWINDQHVIFYGLQLAVEDGEIVVRINNGGALRLHPDVARAIGDLEAGMDRPEDCDL